jgi:hypothetical protein
LCPALAARRGGGGSDFSGLPLSLGSSQSCLRERREYTNRDQQEFFADPLWARAPEHWIASRHRAEVSYPDETQAALALLLVRNRAGGYVPRVERSTPVRWPGRLPLLVAAALSGPLLIRAVLLSEKRAPWVGSDLVGMISDLAVALLVAAILLIASRLRAAWVYVLLLPWCLLQYGNYEHVTELGAGLQLTFASYLTDKTFLLGSALSPTRPGLLALTVLVPTALAFLALRRPMGRAAAWPLVVCGLGVGYLITVLPRGVDTLSWRDRNFVQEQLEHALRVALTSTTPWLAKPNRADLSGEPLLAGAPGSNVILLILEGISGRAISQVVAHHGAEPGTLLESLGRAAERGLIATNFVLHQRQTNRGVYSILCGDYPKLDSSTPKMTLYLQDDARACLPRILRANGYETVYLQGAPLPFMFKDAFMPLAGFNRVYGDKDFEAPEVRSFWGVDDQSLLRKGVALIRDLEAGGKPWLLTLLSVGTHHPEVVPDAYLESTGLEGREAALTYLDQALDGFLQSLAKAGVLDDTLLIITSDESRGEDVGTDLGGALSSSWGPLVALFPEASPFAVHAPYGQSDIAVSVLDYLEIPWAGPLLGRSLFRSYPTPRSVYFANVFLRRTGALDARGYLHFCNETASECVKYRADPARLFSPDATPIPAETADIRLMQTTIASSLTTVSSLGSQFSLDLIRDPIVPVKTLPEQQLLHGQNLEIPAHSRIDVAIELQVEGEAGKLALHYRMGERGRSDHVRVSVPSVAAGDVAIIRYAFENREAMSIVKFALSAEAERSDELTVNFFRANVSVSPLPQQKTTKSGIVGKPIAKVIHPR